MKPGEKSSTLAKKLAIVALGAATLAIAYAGQLPALAYGPPPPPPVAPGGYQAVVTSTTVGPAGASIVVNIGACPRPPDGAPGDLRDPGPAHHHGAERAGNRRRRPSRLPRHLRDWHRHH